MASRLKQFNPFSPYCQVPSLPHIKSDRKGGRDLR
jgi:hypothetical protein